MIDDREFRSGCCLPRIIQLHQLSKQSSSNEAESTTKCLQRSPVTVRLSESRPSLYGRVVQDEDENRNYTDTPTLEEYLKKTSLAILQLQSMIYKAEESYHDDTYSHGNIYRGVEPLLDFKITPSTAGSIANGGQQMQSGGAHVGTGGSVPGNTVTTKRRMTSEDRWFSASCGVTVIPPNKAGTRSKRGRTSTSLPQQAQFLGSNGVLANVVSSVHGITTVGPPSNLQHLHQELDGFASCSDKSTEELKRVSPSSQAASLDVPVTLQFVVDSQSKFPDTMISSEINIASARVETQTQNTIHIPSSSGISLSHESGVGVSYRTITSMKNGEISVSTESNLAE